MPVLEIIVPRVLVLNKALASEAVLDVERLESLVVDADALTVPELLLTGLRLDKVELKDLVPVCPEMEATVVDERPKILDEPVLERTELTVEAGE